MEDAARVMNPKSQAEYLSDRKPMLTLDRTEQPKGEDQDSKMRHDSKSLPFRKARGNAPPVLEACNEEAKAILVNTNKMLRVRSTH
jgi:hypothetical protein